MRKAAREATKAEEQKKKKQSRDKVLEAVDGGDEKRGQMKFVQII